MFSALFLDHYKCWCAHKRPCSQSFDFTIDCHSDRYVVQKIKGLYNRVIAIRIFKANGACFEPFQKFSACQFYGKFFANVRIEDCSHNGAKDIIADVYDADSFPVGTVVLVNSCCTPPCPAEPCDSPCHHRKNSYTMSDNCIHIHPW